MAFDENKYKKIFESRYGSGSFESGLSQAREIGASKVQADLAMSALKKQREKALKKTYDDALNYWNDPANKEHLLGRGAHNIENDYLNDPREKARVKELGFTKEDYIDAMYSASTNGTARSKREKKQQEKKQDFNVSDEQMDLVPMLNNKTKEKTPTKSKKKEVNVPKPTKKKSETNLWDDLKAAGKMAYQGFNPFDDVSMEEAFDEYTNRNTSKAFDEVARGSNRAVDSASLGAMSNLDKKINDRDPYYLSERKFGEGGGTDMITTGLGYLVPGVGMYKGLNATKAGNALTQFGSKGITQRLASEAGKGSIIGAGMSGTEVGIREGLNPDDYNWKQNLGYIGLNTGIGAVADPLMYGVGKGFTKGMESAANNTMKNLLPNTNQVEEVLKGSVKANQAENALPIVNRNLDSLIPRGNDIANPNYVPSLAPQPKPQVTVPKVGTSLEEALANPRPDLPVTGSPTQQPKIAPSIDAEIDSIPRQLDQVNIQPNERKHYSTVGNSEKISPELLQRINDFDKSYTPMSNQELVDFANEYVARDIEQAYQFVKNANKYDPRHTTVGHRLIDELQKSGQYDKALDVVERIAEQGTKAGQNVQAFSLYNRLSPEGQLLRAQRRVNKINESIPNPEKQVKLTEANIQDITHAADSIRKFTGQEEMTNNVIKVMDKIKNKQTVTDAELETVRSFVSDAKKFIGDISPKGERKAPKPIKDVRTRDKVIQHLNSAEEAAKQRLKQKMNRANSLPVDIFYDLTIIGASKIAKGTIKLADFTEEMAKEFGDHIRPYINQIYDKSVETFNLQSESMSPKRLSEVEKITNKALKDKNLSEDEAEIIREFASRIGKMSGDAKLESSMELQSILQGLERPTFGQMISTTQTIAMLLNPKTIVRNALGNEMFYRIEQMNKFLATPIDIARSKITGKERTITFISNNQGQYWSNFLSGAKAGWKGQNPMGLTTAYDLGSPAFSSNAQNLNPLQKVMVSKANPLKWLEKSLGATLRSFDNAGYMRAYNKTIGEMATLRAINEGLKGDAKKQAIQQYIREADENMVKIADQYAKYATFQDNTALSTLLTKGKQGLNTMSTKALTLGMAPTKEFGFGDLVLKFPKTPGNLIMRALEYSPAGVIRSASLMKDAIKTKNPLATKEATLAFQRAITGTAGFSILGYALADIGILTGRGDSDYEVAALERNAGVQPNSVNITGLKRLFASGFDLEEAKPREGDTYVSYDWAQPIAMAVSLGVGVNQAVKENEDPSLVDAGLSAFNSAADTVINMSVLSGLNNFVTGYQGEGMSEKIAGTSKGLVSSFVPTALNQVRQLNDNAARSTYDPSFWAETENRAQNRIPGYEKSLQPAYDTLGNEREVFQGGSNNAFNVFLNPSFVSKYNPTPEEKFVIDYINETGDKSVAPRIPDKKLDGKKLTAEQYAKMQRIMGLEAQKGFNKVVPRLQGTTDYEKINKILKKVLLEAGRTAREEVRADMK
jgi:hypothetical protein